MNERNKEHKISRWIDVALNQSIMVKKELSQAKPPSLPVNPSF